MPVNLKSRYQFIIKKALLFITWLLSPLESYLGDKFGNEGIALYPPVFIIGAPRCGSTLLLKLITERYKFAFINNFSCRLFKIPICGNWIAKTLGLRNPDGDYEFQFGHVRGLGAPNECGEFWYRWFPRGLHVYVPAGAAAKQHLKELRLSVGGISYLSRRPMVFKNLYNSMRIAPILEAIPEASFIVCRRDYKENALALLTSRIANHRAKDKWWSLPPKEIDDLMRKGYHEQVAGQIYYTYKQIDEDKNKFGQNKFFEVEYANLCRDVHGALDKIGEFLSTRGCRPLINKQVPPFFPIRRVGGLEERDRCLVIDAVDRILK
jgi:hypothetical protein